MIRLVLSMSYENPGSSEENIVENSGLEVTQAGQGIHHLS